MNALILAVFLSATQGNPNNAVHAQERIMTSAAISAGVNGAIGCLVGGFGALYNNGSFLTGCGWGTFGGLVVAEAKEIAGLSGRVHGFGAFGKLAADLGNSIIFDAMHNERPSHFTTAIGPVIIRVGKGATWGLYVTPIAELYSYSQLGTFNWRESVYNLTPVFDTPSLIMGQYDGVTLGSSIVARKDLHYKNTISHEQIHVIQSTQFALADDFKWGHWYFGRDIAFLAVMASEGLTPYYNRPLELEAYGLARN